MVLEAALAAAFAPAIRGYVGEIVFMVIALIGILLIGSIGGTSALALPLNGLAFPPLWRTPQSSLPFGAGVANKTFVSCMQRATAPGA